MTNLKIYLKSLILSFSEIILMLLITTFFYYKDFISSNVFKLLELLFLLIIIFINCFYFIKRTNINKIKCSIYYTIPFISISLFISLINKEFHIKLFIYYLILIFISLLSGYFYKKKDD